MATSMTSFIAGEVVEQGDYDHLASIWNVDNNTTQPASAQECKNASQSHDPASGSLLPLNGLNSWADIDPLSPSHINDNTKTMSNQSNTTSHINNQGNPIVSDDATNQSYSAITSAFLKNTRYEESNVTTNWKTEKTVSCKIDPRWRISRFDLLNMLDDTGFLEATLSVYLNVKRTFAVITFITPEEMHGFLSIHSAIRNRSLQWCPLNTPFTYVSLMSALLKFRMM